MSIANPAPGITNGSTTSIIRRLFEPVESELALVTQRLQRELRHEDPFIDELAKHCFRIGGKRLRPALLLLAAKSVGEINDAHRVLAAVVEMVHTATLVHDDVLDEAEIRRHEQTANARWDNQTSVLLGDYLFSHAFYLASTLDTTFGCRAIGRATNTVCEGELKQTAASGTFDIAEETYFDIIQAKTAELTACSALLGAHYAGADAATVKVLESYGKHIGIAFQIADDLLDLEGEEHLTGKSLGTDLTNQKMTLPLIQLRDSLNPAEQSRLRSLFEDPSSEKRATLVSWLEASGAMQHARTIALRHIEQATSEIEPLPDTPAKRTLLQIAQFVVRRNS